MVRMTAHNGAPVVPRARPIDGLVPVCPVRVARASRSASGDGVGMIRESVRTVLQDLMSVMERTGQAQIQTTQKYLHTLADTDQRNLDALCRVQTRRPSARRVRTASSGPPKG